MKKCKECKLEKSESDFYEKFTKCKKCVADYYQKNKERMKEQATAFQKANPEKAAEYRRRFREKAGREDCVARLLRSARKRAAEKGLEFSLKRADVVIPEICPVLGIELDKDSSTLGPCANVPSLDRLNPALGYVPANVNVISFRANTIKNDATTEELEKVIAWMKKMGAEK
jgi:hypothetical protein